MTFLSNDWINWFSTNYSQLIDFVKWCLGTPLAAWLIAKVAAIINKDIRSDNPVDFIRNKWGKDMKV